MANLSLRTRILRHIPGLAGYFQIMDALDGERLAALAALQSFDGGLDRGAAEKLSEQRDVLSAANDLLCQQNAEITGALQKADLALEEVGSKLAAVERECAVLRIDLGRIAEERDVFRSRSEALENECAILRMDLSRIAEERDHFRSAHAEIELLRGGLSNSESSEHSLKLISRQIESLEERALRAIANVSAGTVGLATRQEEALARLGRFLRGNQQATGGRAVDLYLDLLESSLTGVLYRDGEKAPWLTTDDFDPLIRSIGRDWPKNAMTMIGTARMRNLRMLLRQAIDEQVEGDFVEAGVWRGGACIYAKGILEACGANGRRVFVADSFRGLPDPNPDIYPADQGDIHSTFTELAISLDVVKENFDRYGLLDSSVVFIEGWFKDTLHKAPIEKIAVLRLDGDMYESTIDTLNALYSKVSPGGFVIIDDYILKPCAKAVDDFRQAHKIASPLQPVDDAAVWWRV